MNAPCLSIVSLLALGILGCRQEASPVQSPAAEGEAWSVTAWGERYEVFAETDALVTGQPAVSNAHVTVLAGFAPLTSGKIAVILRGPGKEQKFEQDRPKRDGIFPVEIRPEAAGRWEIAFLVDGPAGSEEIRAGAVTVGTAEAPGGLVEDGATAAPDAVSFLKEQQWRTAFATAAVIEGSLRESVTAPGRVKAAAGGEVMLTAPVDATVATEPWPYPGRAVSSGKSVLRLLPREGGRSLPELQAEAASLTAEVDAAKRRSERLDELVRLGATSIAELERARATLSGLEARLRSAQLGLRVVTAPAGSPSDAALDVIAPWSGRIAEVAVSPGQTVSAGSALVRLVKERPLWTVLALRPADAARVGDNPTGLLLRRPGVPESLRVEEDGLRVVSWSPEVDPRTGTLDLILELDRDVSDLPIGSSFEAELLLSGERRGIVIPISALVDDGGVSVVYVQSEGESFARRETRVIARQGEQALVEGLQAGERLVTRGGGAIRRSALVSSGAPEGHVH